MMLADVITSIVECFLSGLFAGLTLWGLARFGMLPIIGLMVVQNEEGNDDEE